METNSVKTMLGGLFLLLVGGPLYAAEAAILQRVVDGSGSGELMRSRAKEEVGTLLGGLGFDGRAYEIWQVSSEKPNLESVRTQLPVLTFAGRSLDGRYLAYTALAAWDEMAPQGKRQITVRDLGKDPGLILVPSGALYIEDEYSGHVSRLSPQGHYVINAVWSPTDSRRIAYTYSVGSMFCTGVVSLEGTTTRELHCGGVLADYLTWSPDGRAVDVFLESNALHSRDGEGHDLPQYGRYRLSVSSEGQSLQNVTGASLLPQLSASSAAPGELQDFRFDFKGGVSIVGRDLLGVGELRVLDREGEYVGGAFADRIEHVLPSGVVFRRSSPTETSLSFLGTTGEVVPLVSALSSVIYRLPFHNGSSPDLYVTQVGESLSSKCNVSSHTGNLSYAYDMQAQTGNEFILAAGSGSVVYTYRYVTCNSKDKVGCWDYSDTCSSNGGWGNVVILQHADGTYTKYTHLRYGSVLVPPASGISVGIGCQIATEGHTGATCCFNKGCGDHLHFQRQSSSSLNGTSMAIFFSDTPNPLSCTSYQSGNAGRSCFF